MAFVLTQVGLERVPGDTEGTVWTYTGNSSYVTGGDSFTPSSFNFVRIKSVLIEAANIAAGAWNPIVIPTYASDGSDTIVSFKIALVVSSTGAQVAAATNTSTAQYTLYIDGN